MTRNDSSRKRNNYIVARGPSKTSTNTYDYDDTDTITDIVGSATIRGPFSSKIRPFAWSSAMREPKLTSQELTRHPDVHPYFRRSQKHPKSSILGLIERSTNFDPPLAYFGNWESGRFEGDRGRLI